MATEVKLPQLAENLTEGEVLSVKVGPGDVVSEGQALLEVEAEKSTAEVPAPIAGKVAEIRVRQGDSVSVGDTILLLEDTSGTEKASAPAGEVKPDKRATPQEKAEAAEAAPPQPKRKPEPEKEAQAAEEKTDAPRTHPAPMPDGRSKKAPASAHPEPNAVTEKRDRIVPAGPATRRLAREFGIDIHNVQGSGPGGRVSADDVKSFVQHLASTAPKAGKEPAAAPEFPNFERWGPIERRQLDGIRRRIAQQMSLAWEQIPHVTQHDIADVSEFESFRKNQEDAKPKITITAIALKASAVALQEFPFFNSSLDRGSGQLILKQYYHLGVAVDTEHGLLVPVIRDVDKKSIKRLAGEIAELAERARQKKLQPDDMRGGTFTITNLGGIGGTAFTPIINFPQVAILGLSRSAWQPAVRDGQVVPRLLLPLSLSYDHRVIDGAAAARFARRIAQLLENPWELLLYA